MMIFLEVSDAVRPDKLFGNWSFWNVSEVLKVRSIFKVRIEAIAVAVVAFANEGILVDTEGILHVSTAVLEALYRVQSDFLSESERSVGVLDLLLFSLKLF